jgi:hypothetical protein
MMILLNKDPLAIRQIVDHYPGSLAAGLARSRCDIIDRCGRHLGNGGNIVEQRSKA